MKIRFTSDIHLDHADQPGPYIADLISSPTVVIAGDIANCRDIKAYLALLAMNRDCKIYFVLGNHDYWISMGYGISKKDFPSMATVRRSVVSVCENRPNMTFLTAESAPIQLCTSTAIIGNDAWYDGRYADPFKSRVTLADFDYMSIFRNLPKALLVQKMRDLADEAAKDIERKIDLCIAEGYKKIVIVMHVPPFREAATYRGKPSDDNWAPFFTSKAMGDVLLTKAKRHPTKQFHVLCGHSHGGSDLMITPNLRVTTKVAAYGSPNFEDVDI